MWHLLEKQFPLIPRNLLRGAKTVPQDTCRNGVMLNNGRLHPFFLVFLRCSRTFLPITLVSEEVNVRHHLFSAFQHYFRRFPIDVIEFCIAMGCSHSQYVSITSLSIHTRTQRAVTPVFKFCAFPYTLLHICCICRRHKTLMCSS